MMRLGKFEDLKGIMEIIDGAKAYLKSCGVDQWQDGYPDYSTFEDDIKNNNCHVCEKDGKIAGVITLIFGEDPTYKVIYNGEWLSNGEPYGTFHRSAVNEEFRGQGIASEMVNYIEEYAKNKGVNFMRADTHRHNVPMHGLFEKHGFTPCGYIEVSYDNGPDNKRDAFEKRL